MLVKRKSLLITKQQNKEKKYMQKKYYVTIFCLAVILIIAPSVCAVAPPIQQQKIEALQERKENLLEVQSIVKTKAVLLKVTVVTKGTDSFTVKGEDGKQYLVKVDSSTQWRRKFWGKSDLAETNPNDVVNIHGKWNSGEMTEVEARLIRNISIQKRHGVFFGTVKSISSNNLVITTAKRGEQTVTIAGSIVNRNQVMIGADSILVNHRIRVKGLWDSKNKTITEVTQIKDFDLPAKPTPTPKPQ
jgi:hypothetical protein